MHTERTGWMTLSQAARALERSQMTVHYHLMRGRLRYAFSRRGHRLIDPVSLEQLRRELEMRRRAAGAR